MTPAVTGTSGRTQPPPVPDHYPDRPRPSLSKILLGCALGIVLVASVHSVQALGINLITLIEGYENAVDFFQRTLPLTLPPWQDVLGMTGQTLGIVILATVLGFLLSVPVALLAASNTSPNRTVRMAARLFIVLVRAVPSFVVAMFFVRALGLGALPGVLALGVGSIGMMSKLYADAIEDVDPGPQEALRAAGAGRIQQIFSGLLPQVRPQLIATALHQFDINLRGSVLLGFVGVSGIGMWISTALETMNYGRGLGLTAVLLVMCLLVELMSMSVRRALLGSREEERSSSPLKRKWLGVFSFRLPSRAWAMGNRSSSARPAQTGATGANQSSAPGEVRTYPPLSPPWDRGRIRQTVWLVIGALVLAGSFFISRIELDARGGFARVVETVGMFFPPSFGGVMDKILASMVETVQMGLAGTLLGILIAIPLALLSAGNVVRNERVNAAARMIVVALRSIPDIVVGIAIVVVTGLGATSGALALAVGSIGFFSKVIADSLEEVDSRVQEAVRSTGAQGGQVFFASTLRQTLPAAAAHSMHQLDRNLRGATGMGIIGAGGIGFYITNASRVLQYDVVTTCVLLIIAMVFVSEALSMWTRKEFR